MKPAWPRSSNISHAQLFLPPGSSWEHPFPEWEEEEEEERRKAQGFPTAPQSINLFPPPCHSVKSQEPQERCFMSSKATVSPRWPASPPSDLCTNGGEVGRGRKKSKQLIPDERNAKGDYSSKASVLNVLRRRGKKKHIFIVFEDAALPSFSQRESGLPPKRSSQGYGTNLPIKNSLSSPQCFAG